MASGAQPIPPQGYKTDPKPPAGYAVDPPKPTTFSKVVDASSVPLSQDMDDRRNPTVVKTIGDKIQQGSDFVGQVWDEVKNEFRPATAPPSPDASFYNPATDASRQLHPTVPSVKQKPQQHK